VNPALGMATLREKALALIAGNGDLEPDLIAPPGEPKKEHLGAQKPFTARGSLFSARGRRGAGVKIAAGGRIDSRNFLNCEVRKIQFRRCTERNKPGVY